MHLTFTSKSGQGEVLIFEGGSTLHHFIDKLYFYCWKKLKKHAFLLKNALTTYYLWRHIS